MTSCGNPATEQDALMTPRAKFDRTKTCVKCKQNVGNIVIRHAVYCKECFFPLVSTRFRKVLGPTINPGSKVPSAKARGGRLRGLMQASGSVVIGFSGGLGSTVLLDLVAKSYFYRSSAAASENAAIASGSEHPRNKAKEEGDAAGEVWRGTPAVCYIELCSVIPGARDRTEDIRAVVKSYSNPSANFEIDFIPLRLEDAFDEAWWKSVGGTDLPTAYEDLGIDINDESLPLHAVKTAATPLQRLHTYLSSLPTPSAVHSAISSLVRVLLLYTASSRSASHLLLGTTLTSLSVNMIAGIGQGSGFAMVAGGLEEVWVDRLNGRKQSLLVVRPLKDVGIKESAFWAWWSNLVIPGRDRYPSAVSPLPLDKTEAVKLAAKNVDLKLTSIDSLTRDFIMGLEKDYPSTVSTIARTLAKVTTKEVGTEEGCAVCQKPAQRNVQEWKTRISIRSYHDEAFVNSKQPLPPHFTAPPVIETPSSITSTPPYSPLTPRLCYACHTMYTSRSSRGGAPSVPIDIPVPVWVRAGIPPPPTATDGQSEGRSEEPEMSTPVAVEDENGEVWRTRKVGTEEVMKKIGAFISEDE